MEAGMEMSTALHRHTNHEITCEQVPGRLENNTCAESQIFLEDSRMPKDYLQNYKFDFLFQISDFTGIQRVV